MAMLSLPSPGRRRQPKKQRRVYRWPPEMRPRDRGGHGDGAGATCPSLDKGCVSGSGTHHIEPGRAIKRAERAQRQWGGGGIAGGRTTMGTRRQRCCLWWGWGSLRLACCTTTNSARQRRACPCHWACRTWMGSRSWASQGTGAPILPDPQGHQAPGSSSIGRQRRRRGWHMWGGISGYRFIGSNIIVAFCSIIIIYYSLLPKLPSVNSCNCFTCYFSFM